MKRKTIQSTVGVLAVTLWFAAGASATLFFEDFEGGSDGTDVTAAPYNFVNVGSGSSAAVRDSSAQLLDPDGLALTGHSSSWGAWHQYVKNFGGLPANEVSTASFKVYAETASNGGSSSHWSAFGVRASTGTSFLAGVNLWVFDTDDGTHNWWIDARHVTDGGSNYWAFPADRFFEEEVTGTIYVDKVSNQVWGSLTDSLGTVTSPSFPIVINGDIDEVSVYWGMYNNGAYSIDPADWDDIRVIPEPASLALLGLGALGLMARMRRR